MIIICFDTETTGLPPKDALTKYTVDYFPHIVSLSWIVYDTETKETLKVKDFVVNCPIPITNSFIHKITDDISAKGASLEFALNHFLDDTLGTDLILCHNYSFDCKMIETALFRLNRTADFKEFKNIFHHCTMMSNIQFCGLKNQYGLKYPKLQEVYVKLFGEPFNNAHNSLADCRACLKCYLKLN
jgi:DNA polymerase III epsilon subunit-like protein